MLLIVIENYKKFLILYNIVSKRIWNVLKKITKNIYHENHSKKTNINLDTTGRFQSAYFMKRYATYIPLNSKSSLNKMYHGKSCDWCMVGIACLNKYMNKCITNLVSSSDLHLSAFLLMSPEKYILISLNTYLVIDKVAEKSELLRKCSTF
ncbi:unnamed protein product [Meganyctiphanes norvegica]|uniref:Uncharacterized protein n=1 Tax=Meganyctiphanes norvegica TaxID=48144 RepID=A0AAV2RY35_MEGNR